MTQHLWGGGAAPQARPVHHPEDQGRGKVMMLDMEDKSDKRAFAAAASGAAPRQQPLFRGVGGSFTSGTFGSSDGKHRVRPNVHGRG